MRSAITLIFGMRVGEWVRDGIMGTSGGSRKHFTRMITYWLDWRRFQPRWNQSQTDPLRRHHKQCCLQRACVSVCVMSPLLRYICLFIFSSIHTCWIGLKPWSLKGFGTNYSYFQQRKWCKVLFSSKHCLTIYADASCEYCWNCSRCDSRDDASV